MGSPRKCRKYIVKLVASERTSLTKLTTSGKSAARRITRARILLLADEGSLGPSWIDKDVAEAVGVTSRTVENVRRKFVNEGLEPSINRKKRIRPPRERMLDGEKEAKLIALSCSKPPEGRARWTMQLLADRLVSLEIVDSISDETVRKALKKT